MLLKDCFACDIIRLLFFNIHYQLDLNDNVSWNIDNGFITINHIKV